MNQKTDNSTNFEYRDDLIRQIFWWYFNLKLEYDIDYKWSQSYSFYYQMGNIDEREINCHLNSVLIYALCKFNLNVPSTAIGFIMHTPLGGRKELWSECSLLRISWYHIVIVTEKDLNKNKQLKTYLRSNRLAISSSGMVYGRAGKNILSSGLIGFGSRLFSSIIANVSTSSSPHFPTVAVISL